VGKTNFSKRLLENLPKKEKRYNVFDSETRGLGIAVYPSGQKTFFHLRKVQGWPERTTIGPFPDLTIENARGKASELNGKLSRWKANDYDGPHPLERATRALTLGELLDEYIARHIRANTKNPERAEKSVRWMFDGYVASWRGRRINSIRRKEVLDLLLDVGEKHGQTMANRIVELLRRLYYFAEKVELHTGENPARRVELYGEHKRTRFLNGEELARLFTALRKDTNVDLQDFVVLALFTGARRGDVLSMQWVDLSLSDNRWTIPNPKSRIPYVVPLAPEAVKVLKRRLTRRKDGAPWVFPSFGKTGHVVEMKRAWKLLLERAKIQDLHIHDLRRTLGSWQAALGTSLPIIGKSLGHASTAATEVYARLDLGPVRASVLSATQAMIAASKKKPRAHPAAGAGAA
jgi:integrase